MKAMILAAGLGTRLLPYTVKRPKPLFPILNKPLLELTVSRLQSAGADAVVVNTHHLRHHIKKALRHGPGIVVQEEEKILGTGGGLRMALPHFGQEPVLAVNGDIYHSIDYMEVYRSHVEAKADVTLVLHDYPRFNDVAVDGNLCVRGFNGSGAGSGSQDRILAFTGIHVINPDVLQIIPANEESCILDCYREVLQQKGVIRAHMAADHFWTDMGTPADYLKLHADLLGHKAPLYGELIPAAAEAPFVGVLNASIAEDAKLLDWV
ncbi:MAG: nucleotidyltransferase family protein, partial [Desulfobulbales bacterium]|nr:nucleotidyltransferase family protein [Desulfobulbales bacterium]